MVRLTTVLFISTITLILVVNRSLSNDAPVNLQGGAAQALAGAVNTVSMESEVVRITLRKKYYVVDATFRFLNTGETTRVDVGFPKRGAGWLAGDYHQTSPFIKFETWVNGRKTEFAEKPDVASIEGSYTLPGLVKYIKETNSFNELKGLAAKDYRWMVKRVVFKPKAVTTTRVRYEASYQDFGAECKGGMAYIYGTGSYWHGNIGESKFVVDATSIPATDRPMKMSFPKEDEEKATCSAPNKGIIECLIRGFKPATAEAMVAVGIACVDERAKAPNE